jgi:heavy metal sensor kinase
MTIFKSIRSRLTAWFILIFALIILIADIYLYRRFESSLMGSLDDALYTIAEEIEHTILKAPPTVWRKEIKNVKDEFITYRFFIQILEFSGPHRENVRVTTRSEILSTSVLADLPADAGQNLPDTPQYFNIDYDSISADPIRLILFPVITEGSASYVIQVGTSLKKTEQALDNLLIILCISGPIILFLCSAGGYLMLTRAIRPVKRVVQTARRISAQDLSLRIDSRNKGDEIGELVATFNQMIERLERSVLQIKQFSADVSHELRTPLTIIRGEIETTLRKQRPTEDYKNALHSVYEEAQKLEKLIDNLLFLSRLESREQSFPLTKVPAFEVLLGEIGKLKPLAEQKGVGIAVEKIEAVHIRGDETMLKRLFTNLLDNALKYTPPGGLITISLEKRGRQTLLAIRDTGIGIPEESLPLIFNRFYRVDPSRSGEIKGSGLGLSIVRGIAVIHRAKIDIQSEINRGTTVSIGFPLFSAEGEKH